MAPWRILTARGWAFGIFGLLGLGVSLAYGQNDVAWVALLLVLLPIAAIIVVGRARLSLTAERSVEPPRVTLGEHMVATLHLVKSGSLPTGLLRFEETVPRDLGRRPRFTIHRLAGEWRREIAYPLMGLNRGRFHIGPLLVRACDPFGLAQIDRRFRSTQEVMVTPEVIPLGVMRSTAGRGQHGESSPQKIGIVGDDDVLVREYRMGDDMRRVHWRSTAKQGELMVRREEQAWDPAATILLDSRSIAHAGEGRTSSFEWAVSAATSVAVHLISSGFRITLIDAVGPLLDTQIREPAAAREVVLLAMTDELSHPEIDSLSLAGDACAQGKAVEMLVAITGRLSSTDVQALLLARSRRAQGLVMVVDVDTFASRRSRGSLEQEQEHIAAITTLREHNWRVVEVRQGTSVAVAWQDLDLMGAGL